MSDKEFNDTKDDFYDDGSSEPSENFLAAGIYKSEAEQIISGYRTFQRKYIVNKMIFRLILVIFAIASSIMMIITNENSGERAAAPFVFLLMASVIGIYFVHQPIANIKKLKAGFSELEGTEYKAEFYTDKIVISTIYNEDVERCADTEQSENSAVDGTQVGEDDEDEEGDSKVPETVIHIESDIVDLLDREDMFIVCVRKTYVFIIPKKAFKPYDVQKIKDKLAVIMGIRYRPV